MPLPTDAEVEFWVESYLDKYGYAPTCFEAIKWMRDRESDKLKDHGAETISEPRKSIRDGSKENGS